MIDAMNRILSAACPGTLPDEEGWQEFCIELHCSEVTVTARKVGNVYKANDQYVAPSLDDYLYSVYEVKEVKFE